MLGAIYFAQTYFGGEGTQVTPDPPPVVGAVPGHIDLPDPGHITVVDTRES